MSVQGLLRRIVVAVAACAMLTAAGLFAFGTAASGVTPLTVAMGTAANYSVLGASAVTNTGDTVLHESVGVYPGPSLITGFPPGVVVPPAQIDDVNGAAQQAQLDLGAAYADAAGRSVDTTTGAVLSGTLQAGVYAAVGKVALGITGSLVLDGNNDPNSVFIFQTDTTLTTAAASSVTLINGAQECNVFWQVGTSATLGHDSAFAGNILAATSISADSAVALGGRALANTGATTLIDDEITAPTCALGGTTTTAPGATTTTIAGGTTTTAAGATTTAASTTTAATTTTTAAGATTTTAAGATTTSPVVTTVPGATTTSNAGATTTTDPAATSPTSDVGSASTTVPAAGPTPTGPTPPGSPGAPATAPTRLSPVVGPPKTDAPSPRPTSSPWSAIVLVGVVATFGITTAVLGARRNARSIRPQRP